MWYLDFELCDWYCSDVDFSCRFYLYYFRKNDVLIKKYILCIICWFFNFLIINFNLKSMFVFKQLKEKNIVEYFIYMWQIEDLICVNGCDMEKIKSIIIVFYLLMEEQKVEFIQWYMDLIEMMCYEGIMEKGYLQINKNIIIWFIDFYLQLLCFFKFFYYNFVYYKVLFYIVELCVKGVDKEEFELEICFEVFYGILLLKL